MRRAPRAAPAAPRFGASHATRPVMADHRTSHLEQLEAESIHVIRELAAAIERDSKPHRPTAAAKVSPR